MKSWSDIYQLSNQMLCLSGSKAIEDFLNKKEVESFFIKVKREIHQGNVTSGYATLEMCIKEDCFDCQYLVSWNTKYEPLQFWITSLRQHYMVCKDTSFLCNLLMFHQDMHDSWENISSWIVKNTDYKELVLRKSSNCIEELLGKNFNTHMQHNSLNFLLETKQIKDKLNKI